MISLKKRILILLKIAAMLATLSGCFGKSNSKDHALEGTLLDKAVVGTVDDNTAFLRAKNSKANGNFGCDADASIPSHQHYTDIINGEVLTDSDDCINSNTRKCEGIEIIDDILSALTPEELEKAINNGLTNQDLIDILTRIRKTKEEKEKPMVLNKKVLVAIY
jgi:hypothetical protein